MLSACTKAQQHEGHVDTEGLNPDPQTPLCCTTLPLHQRVLDGEGILRFTWSHFSFSTRLSFIYVFIHSSNVLLGPTVSQILYYTLGTQKCTKKNTAGHFWNSEPIKKVNINQITMQ